jgi:hypothetical protein
MISLNEFKKGKPVQTETKSPKVDGKQTKIDSKPQGGASTLFTKLFEARDFAHYAHLQTESFAQHKALGSFYENVVDLADTFYETHAGQYGKSSFSPTSGGLNKGENPISYLESLAKMLTEAHSFFDEKDTHLHNILDEITALTYHTVYKLKYLK